MTVALRDKRRRDWFWGEKAAVERLEDDAQVAVYVALLILSGDGSLVWASQETLARISHVSTRTVGRVLPDLERLRVIQRASEKTIAALSERLQEVPGTVVYELCNVERGAQEVREPEDSRPLQERLADVQEGLSTLGRKKSFVAVLRKWMAQQTGREVEFPWLIKLYDQSMQLWGTAGEDVLVRAAEATVKAKPQGSVLGYMTRVLRSKNEERTADPIAAAHIATATAQQFGGFE